MRFIHYFINLVFCFALGVSLLCLCLFTWQIDQILSITFLIIICIFALINNNLKS